MQGTVDDEKLPLKERQELMLKKIPRDLAKWRRDPGSFSNQKLRKLRRIMRDIGISESPWVSSFEEIKKIGIIHHVMDS